MNLLKKLNIPLCPPQRIPVKTLVEQLQPNSVDKKLIESHIASMNLISILNEQTIRIRSYKDDNYSYQSIYVFMIELKKDNSIVSLSNLIHSAFPEPTIIIHKKQQTYFVSLALKRINKVEEGKTVVEDIITTQIPETANKHQISLQEISGVNLMEYYANMIQWLYKLKVLQITKVYPIKSLDFKSLLKQYEQLIVDLNKLKDNYKKATMKSEKVRIDDEIYVVEKKLKIMVEKIKNN